MEIQKTCLRQGCRQKYTDESNTENSCKYHDGKPIFHDVKKGWTCCNIVVYDWEEFMIIPGCKISNHTNSKEEADIKTDFFKSQTVLTAEKGIDNYTNNTNNNSTEENNSKKEVIKDIKSYEEEQKRLDDEKKKLESEKPKIIIKTNDGKYYCGNPGCTSKTYDPEQNSEGSCQYHTGQPMFHDRKKFWVCCKQEAYDWDDFVKLPACAVGQHTPKYKN